MLTRKSIAQIVSKMRRLEDTLEARLFKPAGQVALRFYQTPEPLHAIPDAGLFGDLPESRVWGGEAMYGWFTGQFQVPAELSGQALFLYPHIGGYEATLWVNGKIHSNFASKHIYGSHGNHYCNRFCASAIPGETFDFALEYYAFHTMPGTQPLTDEAQKSFEYPIGTVEVCTRDELFFEYLFDLKTITSLIGALSEDDFRRTDAEYALYQIHQKIFYDPDCASDAQFRDALKETLPILKAQLARKNSETGAYMGLVGHSHMDTAWLWPLSETVKKCARTYANQLNLMEEYPEYTFVQSSAYHAEVIRRHYPELFARIQQAVAQGRYEPNGGVWVECDCNITGGEYMIRQFLWGQRFTRKYFGYTANAFWLPDTFGYSFAIPQIMKGCGVDYFLTTKMTWNDTNTFPYTSFYWQGLDGTKVLTHMNRTHIGPSPDTLIDLCLDGHENRDPIREKISSNMRLFSYGKGDGGGGPEFEMIEMSRRVADLEGVPRSGHTTVGRFMDQLRDSIRKPTVYADELYLELHRGTLTNQHAIKRNNRLSEIALHDLEYATVRRAVEAGQAADGAAIHPLTETLLVNQFHDILPGTCIHRVHQESIAATSQLIRRAQGMTCQLLSGETAGGHRVTITNTLSFDRNEVIYLPDRPGMRIREAALQQRLTDLKGQALMAVYGVTLPAMGSVTLTWEDGEPEARPSAFAVQGETIETPFAHLALSEGGAIRSMVDKRQNRELVSGQPFNTLLMAEDVSTSWDNWDIDADLEEKLSPSPRLLNREIVSNGPVELRIRSRYALSEKSSMVQDMILYAHSPMISFDTQMDWQDGHRFLKAAFDTSLHADGVRNEIQFGYIRRSNHRSTDAEKARFEICNHRYSDLSEAKYGIALLNDCKYGLSVQEGSMRLSLHKGGMLPDPNGDCGLHDCRYAILPHDQGFSAQCVTQQAYAFNYLPIVTQGEAAAPSLLKLDAPNVIVEAVKPCEDAGRAYVLRLYEAEGAYTHASLKPGHDFVSATECNMLEEETGAPVQEKEIPLTFRPFEIKTLKVSY